MRSLTPEEQAHWIDPTHQAAPGAANKPPALEGLAKRVGSMLENRVGIENALGRNEILHLVRELPIYRKTSDRQLRAALEELRDGGILVCNMTSGDGYFIARTEEEYRNFKALFLSHCLSMLETVKQMDRTAELKWGSLALQERLL
jgi:hypothetical protein